MKISFVGDIMLGRLIGNKYKNNPYEVVSGNIKKLLSKSDFVIANLESPLSYNQIENENHLQFLGNPDILKEFEFVNLFSTANNHITDCGEEGINDTINILDSKNINHNGVFKKSYLPFIINKDGNKIAIFTLTDMLNIPFDESSSWNVLRFGENKINELIQFYKDNNYLVIIFAHVGMLFTRYPNPITVDLLHGYIDNGADLIVTSHSHCLGGVEKYKGRLIFHSIGDFCMDGSSMRRRRAAILNINLNNNSIEDWNILPVETNYNLEIHIPKDKIYKKILKSFNRVSDDLNKNQNNYKIFFKKRYNKEIFFHSISTLTFLYKEKGIWGLLKLLKKRFADIGLILKWISTDRSKIKSDDDAIDPKRTKISQKDLYGE